MQPKVSYRNLSPKEVYELGAGGVVIDLVDVRTAGEFAYLHAQGARSVPLSKLTPESVQAGRRGSPDQPLYVICHSGGRSRTACEGLAATGLNVVNVEGGTSAWKSAGLPVVRGGVSRRLPAVVRVAGVLVAVAALVLGVTFHSGFLWVAMALWITLLVVNGGCPLGSCSIAAGRSQCAQPDKRG